MYTLIIVLVILASILMCGIVLIQESKGGGLASGFSSSNQIMGVGIRYENNCRRAASHCSNSNPDRR